MSGKPFGKLEDALQGAAADAAWIQWQALGALAAARREPRSTVDPEALVLLSLTTWRREPRLWDFLYGFAELGSRLLSVQRLRTLAKAFPEHARTELQALANAVLAFKKDMRWRSLAGPAPYRPGRPRKVQAPRRRLAMPGALVLRLRTGFGVDVRTDVLAYLIGRRQAWATVREMASALSYAEWTVRLAAEALADARLIEGSRDRPVRYYAPPARWAGVLELKDVPVWHPWSAVYAFVSRTLDWFKSEAGRLRSDYLASSEARRLILREGAVLESLQLDVPNERDYLGEAYLDAFGKTLETLGGWMREHA